MEIRAVCIGCACVFGVASITACCFFSRGQLGPRIVQSITGISSAVSLAISAASSYSSSTALNSRNISIPSNATLYLNSENQFFPTLEVVFALLMLSFGILGCYGDRTRQRRDVNLIEHNMASFLMDGQRYNGGLIGAADIEMREIQLPEYSELPPAYPLPPAYEENPIEK